MSPFNWFLLLVVVAIFLFGFILIVARIARPHSKKMVRGQAQLNKKRGATAPAAVGTAGVTPVTPSTLGERASEWFMKYLWSILLVIAGIVAVSWVSNAQVKPADVGSWSWNHPLQLLIVWGVIAAIIALNAGKAAKALQWVLAGVMLMLFVGMPIVNWALGEKSPSQQAQNRCLPFSSTEVHKCLLTEKAVILTADQLTYENEFEFCVVKPDKGSYHAERIRPNTFEIRSTDGVLPIEYKLLNGSCPNRF